MRFEPILDAGTVVFLLCLRCLYLLGPEDVQVPYVRQNLDRDSRVRCRPMSFNRLVSFASTLTCVRARLLRYRVRL